MGDSATLLKVFAIFIPALILPGPDFIAVVRSSLTRGATAGLLTALGVSIGLGFYAALGLLGLSAILARFEWLAWAIRIAGGAYLIYLGIRLILAKPDTLEAGADDAGVKLGNPVLFGLGVTLTNPKAIVLFASVFATSVTSQTPQWLMGVMVALVVASGLSWYTIVSLFMSSAPVIRSFGHARRRIEQVAGLCFILIGGRILLDRSSALSP